MPNRLKSDTKKILPIRFSMKCKKTLLYPVMRSTRVKEVILDPVISFVDKFMTKSAFEYNYNQRSKLE